MVLAKHPASSTFTTEFGHEFEAERGAWLHRRFLWYTGAVGVFYLLMTLSGIAFMIWGGGSLSRPDTTVNLSVHVASLVLFGYAFLRERGRPGGRGALLRTAAVLIIVNGLVRLGAGVVLVEWL